MNEEPIDEEPTDKEPTDKEILYLSNHGVNKDSVTTLLRTTFKAFNIPKIRVSFKH